MMKLKVQGHPGLVRDSKTKAIINDDINSYKSYQADKSFRYNLASSSQLAQQELNNVKQDIAEIKNILAALCQKLEEK